MQAHAHAESFAYFASSTLNLCGAMSASSSSRTGLDSVVERNRIRGTLRDVALQVQMVVVSREGEGSQGAQGGFPLLSREPGSRNGSSRGKLHSSRSRDQLQHGPSRR